MKLETTELTSPIAVPCSGGCLSLGQGSQRTSPICNKVPKAFRENNLSWGNVGYVAFIAFNLLSSQIVEVNKFSYCPSDLNLNLGNFQRNCLGFYKLAPEMAISPGLVSDGAFCFTLQTLFGPLSLKELREWMECVRNVGLEAGSLLFASHPRRTPGARRIH